MKETKEVGTEVGGSNRELPKKVSVDILNIMKQCGVPPEKWKNYIGAQHK